MKAVPFIAMFAVGGLVGMFAMRTLVEIDAPPERAESYGEESIPVPMAAEEDGAQPVPAIADLDDPAEQDLLVSAIQAIREVDPVDLGDRTGRISGRVALFDGTPLPGVAVTATPGTRPGREEAEDLEGKVRTFIRDEMWRTGLESKGTTGSEGTYLLEGIGDIEYRVSAKLAGYRFETRARRGATRAGDVVDFTATPVAQIEVSIVRADGTEPEQANVMIARGNGSSGHTWKPKERTLNVEPGMFRVSASTPDGERSETVDVTAEAGGAPVPVRLALRTRGSIRGELVLPPEESDTDVTVYLLSAALKPAATAEDLFGAEKKTWSHRGSGFTFEDLDPGAYWIGAARGHEHQRQVPTIQRVEVGDGPVDVAVEVPGIALEEGVLVTAYAPNGVLIPDVQVSLGVRSEHGSNWGGGMSTRLRDGSTLVIADENLDNAFAQQRGAQPFVRAYHNVYGESRTVLSSLRGERVEVRYQDPASAVILVSGYVGSALVGKVQVQLVADDGTKSRDHYWNHNEKGIDSSGEIRLGPYGPGPHFLRLNYFDNSGGYWSMGLLAEQSVHLVPGENRLSIALPPVHALVVVFPDASASGSLQVQLDGESDFGMSRHTSFKDGQARVEGLIAGRYRIHAWGEGMKNGMAFVDIPASGPFHFEPAPINALRIQVTDEAGPLAEAGFQSGDMIVKINGQPFEGEEQLAIMGVFLQGASEVKVTVDRGGEEIELTVDPRKLMGGNPGGQVDPTVR